MLGSEENAQLRHWVRRCRNGDERAWTALIRHLQAYVYSVPRRMGLSEDECQDVFQATFLALHKNLDRIEGELSVPKWLAVTASRESYRILRKKKTDRVADVAEDTLEAVLADEKRAVDAQVELAESNRLVRVGMAQISERCRELLDLLYSADEVSYGEISERLAIPVGSIGPTRARCLQKLRDVLIHTGFFDGVYQGGEEMPLKKQSQ